MMVIAGAHHWLYPQPPPATICVAGGVVAQESDGRTDADHDALDSPVDRPAERGTSPPSVRAAAAASNSSTTADHASQAHHRRTPQWHHGAQSAERGPAQGKGKGKGKRQKHLNRDAALQKPPRHPHGPGTLPVPLCSSVGDTASSLPSSSHPSQRCILRPRGEDWLESEHPLLTPSYSSPLLLPTFQDLALCLAPLGTARGI